MTSTSGPSADFLAQPHGNDHVFLPGWGEYPELCGRRNPDCRLPESDPVHVRPFDRPALGLRCGRCFRRQMRERMSDQGHLAFCPRCQPEPVAAQS